MPPGEPAPALEVADVSVQFGGVAALTHASLTVEAGSVTGLIGPNGAGKTTLFNVISGLQTPDRGTVSLFGQDVTTMKPHLRAKLGLARTFQRLEVFGSLSSAENVQVGLESTVKWWEWRQIRRAVPWRRHGEAATGGTTPPTTTGAAGPVVEDGPPAPEGSGPALARATCERLLAGVGLGGLGSRQSSTLPTGQARMVELARALAIGPELLLLDEPGSGLDEAESTALGDLLVRLAHSGMAILLVEHDMELVMRVCSRIHVLDFGEVIASGPPETIREDPRVQAAYLGTFADSPSDSASDGPSDGADA